MPGPRPDARNILISKTCSFHQEQHLPPKWKKQKAEKTRQFNHFQEGTQNT